MTVVVRRLFDFSTCIPSDFILNILLYRTTLTSHQTNRFLFFIYSVRQRRRRRWRVYKNVTRARHSRHSRFSRPPQEQEILTINTGIYLYIGTITVFQCVVRRLIQILSSRCVVTLVYLIVFCAYDDNTRCRHVILYIIH